MLSHLTYININIERRTSLISTERHCSEQTRTVNRWVYSPRWGSRCCNFFNLFELLCHFLVPTLLLPVNTFQAHLTWGRPCGRSLCAGDVLSQLAWKLHGGGGQGDVVRDTCPLWQSSVPFALQPAGHSEQDTEGHRWPSNFSTPPPSEDQTIWPISPLSILYSIINSLLYSTEHVFIITEYICVLLCNYIEINSIWHMNRFTDRDFSGRWWREEQIWITWWNISLFPIDGGPGSRRAPSGLMSWNRSWSCGSWRASWMDGWITDHRHADVLFIYFFRLLSCSSSGT